MKKLFLFLAILSLNFAGLNSGFAQAKLGIQSLQGLPATVQIGKIYQFKITIRNKGNQSWTGKPVVLYKTDMDSSQTPPSYFYFNTSGNSITMHPGDTVVLNSYFKPESTHWRVGKNIVVIWPAAMIGYPPVASDSTHIEITGLSGVGIDEKSNESLVRIFPNPAIDQLNLIVNGKQNELERVRILNLLGEELFLSETLVSSISLDKLKSGIYFLEVKLRNRSTLVYRFVKQ